MPGMFADVPVLFAQGQNAAGGDAAPALWTFLPYVAIIGLWFYLLMIRPQMKQERERREMMSALKKNDRVLTAAGIYGTVVSVDEKADRVVVRIDDDRGVKVTFTRASIARILEAAEKDKEKEKTTGAV
ncbi:MAG: preprotein translocase subunit YajC [Isosphaeraceae bacterium]